MTYSADNIYYVLFPTTRSFIRAHHLVEESGIKHRVVSVPDHLSSECGMSLQITGNQCDSITNILREAQINFEIQS
ncbi:DUF3343 domain-containing protein [Porphyromonas pogonae]|uniref:DUF3343 domain-containing protein n=1 Tax=Porphyromonas pogonae TaxID=867595 RepID=UPI0038B69584